MNTKQFCIYCDTKKEKEIISLRGYSVHLWPAYLPFHIHYFSKKINLISLKKLILEEYYSKKLFNSNPHRLRKITLKVLKLSYPKPIEIYNGRTSSTIFEK